MKKQALTAPQARPVSEDLNPERQSIECNRLQSALISSISHDLKTPLTTILGVAKMLRDTPRALSAGTKVNLLTDIIEEAERLDRYVTSLLNMAKLEAGSAAPIFSLYDIDDIVSATLRRTAKILAHHHVELDLDSDLPMVKLDGPLFEQVLFNLLDNAAKYSPRESAIRIRARRDADAVCLQVLDEGPGIPDAELNSIFEKFYRVNNGNQAPAGTGLGLTICRGFIEAMHGSITAANRIGQRGAVFTVKVNSSREPPDHDPLERKPLAMVA